MFTQHNYDIFQSDAECFVNPVNCVGVSGKGLAKKFKDAFPKNFLAYKKACDEGNLRLGHVFLCSVSEKTDTYPNLRFIANFPTKNHWRDTSSIRHLSDGLLHLSLLTIAYDIRSLAIPAIGCGLGGLSWKYVEPLIKIKLKMPEIPPYTDRVYCDIRIHPPLRG